MPEEWYRAGSVSRLAEPYRGCVYLSAAQATRLARAEATPFSAVAPPRGSVEERLDLFAEEIGLRSALLKTLWTALWEFIFLLGKYSQAGERADFFARFGRLAQCLTRTCVRHFPARREADLTVEQLPFDPRDFKRVLGEAAVEEKFVRSQHVIDAQLKELCDKGQLPLLFVERFELGAPEKRALLSPAAQPQRRATSSSLRPLKALHPAEPRNSSWAARRGSASPPAPAAKTSIEQGAPRLAEVDEETLPLTLSALPEEPAGEVLAVFNPLSNSMVQVQLPRGGPAEGFPRSRTVCAEEEPRKEFFGAPKRAFSALFAPRQRPHASYPICVIVHGLEGFGHDMRYFRSVLRHICPGHSFYISEANEQCTHESLETMGLRLAAEVKFFLKSLAPETGFTLSFIGHSLGGLIVRAALPHLKELRGHFRGYFSVNSPHLGCVSGNVLVNAGLLFLGKLERNKSIRQMTMEDKERCLEALSASGEFDHFETLVFLSAYKDGYVGFDSAKVLARFDNGKGLGARMARNLLGDLRHVRTVVKVGVFVPGLDVGLDKFIGRNAHIEALRNALLQNLVWQQLKEFI